MLTLFQRMKWETLLLHRNNLLTISLVVTLLYAGLFQLLKMLGFIELFSIMLVLNDPAVIGTFFVGITLIFERDQGTLHAVKVSPLNPHAYILGKVIVLTLLGTLCGWLMGVSALGFGILHHHFILGLMLVTFLFSNIGIIIGAGTKRFIDFALRAGLVFILMIIPLLDWFGVCTIPLIEIFPVEHSVRILAYAIDFQITDVPWISYLALVLAGMASYIWAYRKYLRLKF